MIDLVAGYAKGYNAKQIRPFLMSLRQTGYEGDILLFADKGAAAEGARWGADVRPVPALSIKVHSDRFIRLEDAIRKLHFSTGVLLADTRDIIFQKNPAEHLPSEGLNVYEEDKCMTLESCPYNSKWLRLGYGEGILDRLSPFPISCVGTVCGDIASIRTYLGKLRAEVENIQPKTHHPQDQAAHNYLIRMHVGAKIWPNEGAEVYTVGYIPRGTVQVKEGGILNASGHVPAVVHQWDRHQNLKALVEGSY